ncbi:PH domain-containing protein [Patescibacteria group bacterium]|nr:PH domain-containing protein [Patescibacteria group bacterium]
MTFSHSKKKFTFPGKDPDEEVSLVIRRYWLFYLSHLFVDLLFLFAPIIAYFFVRKFLDFDPSHFYSSTLPLLTALYYLALSTYMLIDFTNYYFDAWIVTNKRIIAIEQRTLFNRVISEMSLSKVQDITLESKGVLETFFHFGTLYVQSAGKKHRFVFESVPKIYQTKETINNLVEKAPTSPEQLS